MRGTAFNRGQMNEFGNSVSTAVSIALPKVAAKFGDPKAVLAGIKDKTEVLAGRLETAIEEAVKSMMALIRRPQRSVTISARRDPATYYQTRPGLYVWGAFGSQIVSKAKPIDSGATFKINEDELGEDLTDELIECGLPKKHLFDESAVAGIVAELIESDQLDKSCVYLLYTSGCVVRVRWRSDRRGWDVYAWERDGRRWGRGCRVLSPAN